MDAHGWTSKHTIIETANDDARSSSTRLSCAHWARHPITSRFIRSSALTRALGAARSQPRDGRRRQGRVVYPFRSRARDRPRTARGLEAALAALADVARGGRGLAEDADRSRSGAARLRDAPAFLDDLSGVRCLPRVARGRSLHAALATASTSRRRRDLRHACAARELRRLGYCPPTRRRNREDRRAMRAPKAALLTPLVITKSNERSLASRRDARSPGIKGSRASGRVACRTRRFSACSLRAPPPEPARSRCWAMKIAKIGERVV